MEIYNQQTIKQLQLNKECFKIEINFTEKDIKGFDENNNFVGSWILNSTRTKVLEAILNGSIKI